MYRLGLKLWSTNTGIYFSEAQRLYREGLFEYVELYVIPDSLHTLPRWETLGIPFTLHAPHYGHDFNLAQIEREDCNLRVYAQVREFADRLKADYIIFHGGNRGSLDVTIRQLTCLHERRALIENKPFHTLKDQQRCLGATPDEIRAVKESAGCEFCLDFGHAVCSANSQGLDPYSYIEAFMEQDPVMFHISGVQDMASPIDSHLSLSAGKLAPERMAKMLPPLAKVTLETAKASEGSLNDFQEDVKWMQSLCADSRPRM